MLADDLFAGTKKYHYRLNELCEPLKQYLGITTAAYIRIGQDGGMEWVTTNCNWAERFIEKNYFIQTPGMVHPDNIDSGFAFVSTSDDQEYKNTMLHELTHEFNSHHGFCYVEKNTHSFTLFSFATDKENDRIINNVINSVSLVKKLARNLTNQINIDFKDLQNNKIDILKLKGDVFLKQKGIVFNEQNGSHKKLQTLKNAGLINQNHPDLDLIKLTKQETNCLRIYVQDRNIKNVARELNIGVTTATDYIENIKHKFNCRNKQELLIVAEILAGLGKI